MPQFVTNVLFGRFVLGTNITPMMYGGTGVTIVGVVLTVFSASVVGTLEADVDDLLALWANPLWLGYLVFTVAFGALMQAVHTAYERCEGHSGTRGRGSRHFIPLF